MIQKILIIRNAYFHDFGGGERFPVHLAQEVTKLGIKPIVVSRSPKLLEYAKSQSIQTVHGWWWSHQDWSGKNILLLPFYVLWQFCLFAWYLQLVLRLKPDVLHPQSKDDFIAATLAGKLLRKRVVWTDHADLKYIYQNHAVWYKNPVGKLIYLISRLADRITLVSHSEQLLIEAQLGHPVPKNYQVIHNGVLDEKISPVSRDPRKVVLCATSRLVTTKGIGELISAANKLSQSVSNVELWLVGDGPESQKFRELAASNDHIKFIGHSDSPLTYVAAADIFVHPSYHEGFSLSLVEAAMLGKSIIACNVGGNPEIVRDGETGLLIAERDESSLLHAIDKLINDSALRRKLGSNARELFVEEFQFDRIVKERFVPLYEK